ncbi:GFA family protein [Sphingomonas sp.]|uniref:GFA family protein n=1 Tax=Sphingomonas sp. TaxID=28214 RepID=UPI001B2CEB6C|nr:GFA family protein [Sphingomonas sp.]MBO9712893.1 GFA family protein [Sphingomonas sp.]
MSEQVMTGGCQCGRVRYSVRVENDEAYLCHCRMCQRATGGFAAAFKNVLQADLEWTHPPDEYASSPIAMRGYCKDCGTPLTFRYPDSPKIDLTVGSFDDPSGLRPISHFAADAILHESWLDTRDLPMHRVDEYQPLVDRWIKAIGNLPD